MFSGLACKTHIAHIARTRGRVGVQRLGAASMPGRWRGRGGFYARQVARNFVATLRQQESTMEQF